MSADIVKDSEVVSAVGDLSNELVRHFLIECTQKGVRLKGCPNEPYFGENAEALSIISHTFGVSNANPSQYFILYFDT